MLDRWSLANFKSVYDDTQFELRPLTLFVGANSAGKSTLIQSLLLVTQTLSNQTPSRQVVLNGHIARLGNFVDVKSSGSESESIHVVFTYRLPPLRRGRARRIYAYVDEGLVALECDLRVCMQRGGDLPDKLRELHPVVQECTVTSRMQDGSSPSVCAKLAEEAPEPRAAQMGIDFSTLTDDLKSSLLYTVSTSVARPSRSTLYPGAPEDAAPVGVLFRHFLPWALTAKYDATKTKAERTVQTLCGLEQSARTELSDDNPFCPRELLDYVVSVIDEAFKQPVQQPPFRPVLFRPRVGVSSASEIAQFNARYARSFKIPFHQHFERMMELSIGSKQAAPTLGRMGIGTDAAYILQEYFAENVRYLGPLRDEPKAVYPLEGSTDPQNVGLKGEYTAAVLDLHKNTTVTYIRSQDFLLDGIRAQPTQAPLKRAVLDWLVYLGLVDGLETRDHGVLGHELLVSTHPDDGLHNLVHVGVGVSQVLPILVMSLLSTDGSLLLFEQPELHLHPKVQTLLADFLLSIIACEKQCIVETHSEYLINRLRYRVADDENDDTQKALAMYFVERRGKKSFYRQISVNEYGAIPEWPEGFFDQSPAESDRILRAAVEKRKARNRNA